MHLFVSPRRSTCLTYSYCLSHHWQAVCVCACFLQRAHVNLQLQTDTHHGARVQHNSNNLMPCQLSLDSNLTADQIVDVGDCPAVLHVVLVSRLVWAHDQVPFVARRGCDAVVGRRERLVVAVLGAVLVTHGLKKVKVRHSCTCVVVRPSTQSPSIMHVAQTWKHINHEINHLSTIKS